MSTHIPHAVREHAAVVLAQVMHFDQPADLVISQYCKRERRLGARDRAQLADIVFGCVRHLLRVQAAATDAGDADALVSAWLDGDWARLDVAALDDEVAADMPDWLLDAWPWGRGEAGRRMADAFNQPAPLDLRVNVAKAKREVVQALLAKDGIESTPGRWSPHALRVQGKPALHRHPFMNDGTLEVQDEGSQLLGFLVGARRSELIVDFCAGAGGKSLQLAAMMRDKGRIHAFDVSAGRLSELSLRARRAGVTSIHPMAIKDEQDSRLDRLAGKVDRVLVDAPCSGLGTLRRSPDLKWRQDMSDIAGKTDLQGRILSAAARLLKPGGMLIYATCSVLRDENEAVVEAFLASHPGFSLAPVDGVLAKQGIALPGVTDTMRLDPLNHDTDGFFGARLVRSA